MMCFFNAKKDIKWVIWIPSGNVKFGSFSFLFLNSLTKAASVVLNYAYNIHLSSEVVWWQNLAQNIEPKKQKEFNFLKYIF